MVRKYPAPTGGPLDGIVGLVPFRGVCGIPRDVREVPQFELQATDLRKHHGIAFIVTVGIANVDPRFRKLAGCTERWHHLVCDSPGSVQESLAATQRESTQ